MALAGALMPEGMNKDGEIIKALTAMTYSKNQEFLLWQGKGVVLGAAMMSSYLNSTQVNQ